MKMVKRENRRKKIGTLPKRPMAAISRETAIMLEETARSNGMTKRGRSKLLRELIMKQIARWNGIVPEGFKERESAEGDTRVQVRLPEEVDEWAVWGSYVGIGSAKERFLGAIAEEAIRANPKWADEMAAAWDNGSRRKQWRNLRCFVDENSYAVYERITRALAVSCVGWAGLKMRTLLIEGAVALSKEELRAAGMNVPGEEKNVANSSQKL